MQNPAAARRSYRELMALVGEPIELSRPATSAAPVSLKARIWGSDPVELASGLDQLARKVIVLADDVEASGFPIPIRKNDLIKARGLTMNVEGVDDSTRRVAGELIAYQLETLG